MQPNHVGSGGCLSPRLLDTTAVCHIPGTGAFLGAPAPCPLGRRGLFLDQTPIALAMSGHAASSRLSSLLK
jgi:hypothetical protein